MALTPAHARRWALIPRALNPFGQGHYQLYTALSIAECRNRLTDQTRPWTPSAPASLSAYVTTAKQRLRGTVDSGGFRLYLNATYRQRAGLTSVRGTWEPTAGGTRIVMVGSVPLSARFWALVLAAVALLVAGAVLHALTAAALMRHGADVLGLLVVLSLFLGVGGVALGTLRSSERELVKIVRDVVNATDTL